MGKVGANMREFKVAKILLEFMIKPASNYTFEWHIERPSGIIDGTDYFTVTEGDTTTYLLEY